MREIKFRAWNEVQEKMLNWYDFLDTNIKNTFVAPESTGLILMQYTGLKDKNGKEIYEGDIIRTKYMDKTFIVWVEYSDEYAEFVTKCKEILFFDEPLSDIGRADREVIGNIYDNPELLEED